jgi:hypothetical protein
MKSITELERDIVNITLKIHHEFPELSKYIGEIPGGTSEKDNHLLGINKLKEYYDSLTIVVSEYAKTYETIIKNKESNDLNSDGYPHYPPSEDIYNQDKQETLLNPEDLSKNKTPNEKAGTSNERTFEEQMTGYDLDVPGSELDNEQENVGSEDEENNYYSLGGDNHNN